MKRPKPRHAFAAGLLLAAAVAQAGAPAPRDSVLFSLERQSAKS